MNISNIKDTSFIIYGKSPIDATGRVVLTGFFPSGKIPRAISLEVDLDLEMIIVRKEDERPNGTLSLLDGKNRVSIPKWLLEELPEGCKELFFVKYKGIHYLSPKTGRIL